MIISIYCMNSLTVSTDCGIFVGDVIFWAGTAGLVSRNGFVRSIVTFPAFLLLIVPGLPSITAF